MKKLSLNTITYILVGLVLLLAAFAVLVCFELVTVGDEGIRLLTK